MMLCTNTQSEGKKKMHILMPKRPNKSLHKGAYTYKGEHIHLHTSVPGFTNLHTHTHQPIQTETESQKYTHTNIHKHKHAHTH